MEHPTHTDLIIDELKANMGALLAKMDQGVTLRPDQIYALREIKDLFVDVRNKDIHNEARGGAKLAAIADKWGITCESAARNWAGDPL